LFSINILSKLKTDSPIVKISLLAMETVVRSEEGIIQGHLTEIVTYDMITTANATK